MKRYLVGSLVAAALVCLAAVVFPRDDFSVIRDRT